MEPRTRIGGSLLEQRRDGRGIVVRTGLPRCGGLTMYGREGVQIETFESLDCGHVVNSVRSNISSYCHSDHEDFTQLSMIILLFSQLSKSVGRTPT